MALYQSWAWGKPITLEQRLISEDWLIAETMGWTLEYVASLSIGRRHEFFSYQKARSLKASQDAEAAAAQRKAAAMSRRAGRSGRW